MILHEGKISVLFYTTEIQEPLFYSMYKFLLTYDCNRQMTYPYFTLNPKTWYRNKNDHIKHKINQVCMLFQSAIVIKSIKNHGNGSGSK